jgi:hypothetical protein
MIVRVRDPIDGWVGGPGPLTLSEVKALLATNTVQPRRPKGARAYVHDPVGGWGDGGEYPHPCQVKSCHVTTPIIAYLRSCPSINPD